MKLKLEEQDLITAVTNVEQHHEATEHQCSLKDNTVLDSGQKIDTAVSTSGYDTIIKSRKPKSSGKKPVKAKKLTTQNPVYVCGLCTKDVLDVPKNFADESVMCDQCPMWYHLVCAGFSEKTKQGKSYIWLCPQCLSN